MIATENLSRDYGRKQALIGLTMSVEPGEILGFLGPNGAGKSTTVKILTGLIQPTGGRAVVAGFDIMTHPLEAKRRLGYVPETGALYESLTPDEYLELMGCLYHLEPKAAATRRGELLDLFGLSGASHQRMSEFSKGMKQKVAIAAALIHKPDVLFLDEPLDGLDANAAMVIKELLKRLAAQGKTILFCSHILEVVERICTRIVIIDKGRKIAEGTSASIAAATGTSTLESAFSHLTGVKDAGLVAGDFLAALDAV
jgi:ABC-2 type transport system ATP-binding protein